jgi:hypothetical protein
MASLRLQDTPLSAQFAATIGRWVERMHVPADLLAGADTGAVAAIPVRGPSQSTIWRVLTGVDAVSGPG